MNNKNSEKKPKKLYNRDEAHTLTDIMIVFIGVCILILAFLSLTGEVPEEYAFGATLAGFFFVFSDVLLVEEEIALKSLVVYGVTLFSGVASFILLPVLLLMDTGLGEAFMSNSAFYTFLALGLVLMTIGYKTLLRKIKQQEKESNEFKDIKDELSSLMEKHEQMTKLIDQLNSDLAEARSLVVGITEDDK